MMYLNPDIITFNEIPQAYTFQMTNFVSAFLPGYYAATNSQGDGFITSVIVSRYPILSSRSHLHHVSLTAFGATGYSFTRDLFQASLSVPELPQPLDVFVTHLKATGSTSPQTDAMRRAAEAAAISNWFATVYLPTNGGRLFTLSGDMNEDIARPGTNYISAHPIQTLASPATDLRLTTPVNPFNSSELTESIQTVLDVRFDYIFPCSSLFSNIASSQVFRTDLLPNPPPPLLSGDDRTASDHLPVIMVFNNPTLQPFELLSIHLANQAVTLTWESGAGQQYRVEASSNLTAWVAASGDLMATGTTRSFTTNQVNDQKFFRVRRLP